MRPFGLLFTCLSSFRGGRYAMSDHDGRPVTEGFPLRDRGASGFGLLRELDGPPAGLPGRSRPDEREPETVRIDEISLRRPDRIQPECRRSARGAVPLGAQVCPNTLANCTQSPPGHAKGITDERE